LLAGAGPPIAELAVGLQERYSVRALALDVTLQLGRYCPATGVLDTIRLGAPAPVVVSAGHATSLGATTAGPPLSTLTREGRPEDYPIASLALDPGVAVYFHTDGAHEFSAGDRPFGRRRLFDLLTEVRRETWEKEALDAMRGAHGNSEFEDDLTVLRIERAGAP